MFESNDKMNKTELSESTKQDELAATIGEFGRWQTSLIILVIFPIKLIASWNQMGIIFLAQKTYFKCLATSNSSDVIKNSTCYNDCVKYEYYTDFENTIISEWDLICDKRWLANFTQTVSMFGVLVGSILFGFIADRYGRRVALLTACLLQLMSTILAPFSPDYWSFTTIRFLIGIATAGTMLCSFIIIMEVVGPKRREFVSCLAALGVPIGGMIMPLFSYYSRAWNKFSLGVGIPNLLFLTYFYLVPESPKWLISVGRFDEAKDVIEKAATCNKKSTENIIEIVRSIAKASRIGDCSKNKPTYIDLIIAPSSRLKNFCSCMAWFILGLSFYGSNQYIGQTSSNVFISVAMAGVLQIPGILISCWLSKKFGRRATLVCLFVVCSASNALLAVPHNWFYFKLVFGSVGVSSASGAFSTMYMYTTELFPTTTRNMAMGVSSTVSRLGSMVAPFVAGGSPKWLPPTVFAIAPLMAIVIVSCLPETRGKTLDDLTDDTRCS